VLFVVAILDFLVFDRGNGIGNVPVLFFGLQVHIGEAIGVSCPHSKPYISLFVQGDIPLIPSEEGA